MSAISPLRILLLVLSAVVSFPAGANEEFFWPEAHETAVARSAAPEVISTNASIWVLSVNGYRRVSEGSNGFNCLVLRQWSAAFDTQRELFDWDGLVAPICYDAITSESSMQEQFLRARLGLMGRGHDEIKAAVMLAYGDGEIQPLERAGFSYMYSAAQRLTPNAGHWHPHIMVHAPYHTNDMLGGNSFDGGDPVVFEASGTYRAIIAIPVNGREGHIAPQIEP